MSDRSAEPESRLGSGPDSRPGSGSDSRPGSGSDSRLGSGSDSRLGAGSRSRLGSGSDSHGRSVRGLLADRDRWRAPVAGPRVRIGIAAGVLTVLTVMALAWFGPLVAVRTVQIDGLVVVPEQEVRAAARIPDGRSMLRVDTDAIAARVAALPRIKSVQVQRSFPSTVRLTVTERTATLYFDSPQGTHLLDSDGVEFAIEPAPPGIPKLITDHPGSTDPVTRAAIQVLAAVPDGLRFQVGEVAARSVSDIELELHDDRTVLWGGPGDSERKAAVVLPVLTRPGSVFDVSSPDLVTVK